MNASLYHDGKVPKLGLGTDCSGGYSPSMINAMRFAVATSNTVAIAKNNGTFLNYKAKMILLEQTYIYCFFPFTKFPIDDCDENLNATVTVDFWIVCISSEISLHF